MTDPWFRPFVWTDYRIALVFTILIPLILLIWAFVQKSESMQRLLVIYWRVASLLAITVYLMIASWPIAFMTGFFARILIPISLWFWADINDDINDQPLRPLKLCLTAWRWAMTIYCLLGTILWIPFLSCSFGSAVTTPYCKVWLEAPLLYKQYFHGTDKPEFLGFFGLLGLGIYVLYLAYVAFVRIGKHGRSALQQ